MTAHDGRRLVVDRREGDLVVVELEDGRTLDLPEWLLPAGVAEGDVLWVRTAPAGEGAVRIEVRLDPGAGAEARAEAEARLRRLRERDPGGDVAL